MRTKELKKSTKYATENGTCVETDDAVERGWYKYRVVTAGKPEKTAITKGLPGDAPAEDPWATSTRRQSTVRAGDLVLRDVVEGVRVTRHRVDQHGESVESWDDVVDPKHIKGTWEAYVSLHGDRLRSIGLKAEAEEAARAESLRLADKLKVAGIKVGAESGNRFGVTIQYMVKNRDGGQETPYPGSHAITAYRLEPHLELKGEDVESALDGIIFDGH